MAQNSLVKAQSKTSFAVYMSNEAVKNQINSILGGKEGQRFISSIVSAVTTNPALAECSNASIVSAALLGEGLKLSPSPQLGHFYMVPFKDRKNNRTVATFQLGYKGMVQLAVRSGQYKRLNVMEIKEGELIKYDPMEEEIEVKLIEDDNVRENTPTIGFFAFFELTNGFRKSIYWSREKMENHAKTYSQGYASDLRNGTKYTFWSKDFTSMAFKTMLRQLISRWGIMSIEMQNAYTSDMAYIHDDGTPEYVDNVPDEPIIEAPVSEVVDPEPSPTPTPAPKGKKSAKAEMPTESAPEPTDEELAAFFAGAQIEG